MPYRLPKPSKPSSVPTGPRFLRQPEEEPPWQIKPPGYVWSLPEWAVEWALIGLKVPYTHQYGVALNSAPLQAGGHSLGQTAVDFYVPGYVGQFGLAIRVQGTYFHYERGSAQTDSDELQRLLLESAGYGVVDIDEPDALANPMYFVKEALQGRDHSRSKIR